MPRRGVLAWNLHQPQTPNPTGENGDPEENLEESEISIAALREGPTSLDMQALLQKEKQLAGIRGATSTRQTRPVPRPGLYADIFVGPEPVPANTSEARTLDPKGRVQLADTAAVVGLAAGDKLSVDVDVHGVIAVTPFHGEALDRRGDTVVLDSRSRLTLPAWVRAYAGITPGDAVMCVAETSRVHIVGAGAFLRLQHGPTKER